MQNTVYIVDDDVEVRTSTGFFLISAGFSVREFGTPQDFLANAALLNPGCVLLDVRMPDIDGFEVLARLASKRAELPVVVMTGHGDVITAVRAMKLGACDFLEKPFEEEGLLGSLDRVFSALGSRVRDMARSEEARARVDSLTPRERSVLKGLLAGQPNKIIAYELEISIRTVEMHRAAMMDRLGVRTLAEALRMALEGDIDPDAFGSRAAVLAR